MTVIWRPSFEYATVPSVSYAMYSDNGFAVARAVYGSVKPSRQWTKSVELSITTYSIVRRFRRTNFSETITPDFTLRTWKALSDCRPTQNEPGKVGFTRRPIERVITQYAQVSTLSITVVFSIWDYAIYCVQLVRVYFIRVALGRGLIVPPATLVRHDCTRFSPSIFFLFFFPFKFNPVLFAAHITVIYIYACVCVCVCNKLRSINDNNSDVI